ncbi:MAG: DUF2075 domain-containing protein [Planctomycetota bacterium]
MGRLAARAEGEISQNDRYAWQETIELLREFGSTLSASKQGLDQWSVLLEYPIPRIGKRVDVILLVQDVVVVLEMKVGSQSFEAAARRQVEDYALDLRDFHLMSRDRVIVPVLCATAAMESQQPRRDVSRQPVQPLLCVGSSDLASGLLEAIRSCHDVVREPIDVEAWNSSAYEPVPTIVEAAQALYAGHQVEAICRSHAGAFNLTRTSQAVWKAIEQARAEQSKVICFITGVPGSGKTLAGLNIVHSKSETAGAPLGAFLSGNGPLVQVLSDALARDRQKRLGGTLGEANRQVRTFIQNVHHFIQHYIDDKPSDIPVDHVLVFDEAQRAWSAEKVRKQTRGRRTLSEPQMLLSAMDRRADWAVIVALVGNGQEIHDGEAGLVEWGRALGSDFGHWRVLAASAALDGLSSGQGLRDGFGLHVRDVDECEDLHLRVSLRAYRAARVSEWADSVVDGDVHRAMQARHGMTEYPLFVTRSLADARTWLRRVARGNRRAGLVASSGAKRLRAWGIHVDVELDAAQWFLGGPEDVRSSHYLELAATEFAIQGLELDWVGLCWGGDFSRRGGGWKHSRFRGSSWQSLNDGTKRRYLANKYRVLLTRAREGMVVWVPPGDANDSTRSADRYDGTMEFLLRCGAQLLPDSAGAAEAG